MTNPESLPSVPERTERLDDETERRIEAVACAGIEWGECEDDPLVEKTLELSVDDAESALRQRIRELVEEARIEGARPFILSTNIPSIFNGIRSTDGD